MSLAFETPRNTPSDDAAFASSSEVQAKRKKLQDREKSINLMIAVAQEDGGAIEHCIKLADMVAPHLDEEDHAWLTEMVKTHHPDPTKRHSNGVRRPVHRDDLHALQRVRKHVDAILKAAIKNPQIEIKGLDFVPNPDGDVRQPPEGTGVGVAVNGDPRERAVQEFRAKLGLPPN